MAYANNSKYSTLICMLLNIVGQTGNCDTNNTWQSSSTTWVQNSSTPWLLVEAMPPCLECKKHLVTSCSTQLSIKQIITQSQVCPPQQVSCVIEYILLLFNTIQKQNSTEWRTLKIWIHEVRIDTLTINCSTKCITIYNQLPWNQNITAYLKRPLGCPD